eukprot:364573-Chlamydomonas_euryale.AAC.2
MSREAASSYFTYFTSYFTYFAYFTSYFTSSARVYMQSDAPQATAATPPRLPFDLHAALCSFIFHRTTDPSWPGPHPSSLLPDAQMYVSPDDKGRQCSSVPQSFRWLAFTVGLCWSQGCDYPGLAMSRALGDLSATPAGVIATPDLSKVSCASRCFVVLASDGVWEFLSNQVGRVVHVGAARSAACAGRLCWLWHAHVDVHAVCSRARVGTYAVQWRVHVNTHAVCSCAHVGAHAVQWHAHWHAHVDVHAVCWRAHVGAHALCWRAHVGISNGLVACARGALPWYAHVCTYEKCGQTVVWASMWCKLTYVDCCGARMRWPKRLQACREAATAAALATLHCLTPCTQQDVVNTVAAHLVWDNTSGHAAAQTSSNPAVGARSSSAGAHTTAAVATQDADMCAVNAGVAAACRAVVDKSLDRWVQEYGGQYVDDITVVVGQIQPRLPGLFQSTQSKELRQAEPVQTRDIASSAVVEWARMLMR